jgi:predicted 3-demethylubiquinone-9 3-methyltransferase (glyoxalase superfamily)
MFVGDQCGRAGEAVAFYAELIPGVSVERVVPLSGPSDSGSDELQRIEFTIGTTPFIAFDSAGPHQFTFTPAVSVWLNLDNEETFTTVFTALAEGGTIHMPIGDYGFGRRFAWVDDRFGVSWQLNEPVTPEW